MTTKTSPLLDGRPYAVVIAAVRQTFPNELAARQWALSQVTEWRNLGYRRVAKVYYRDGSPVAEVRTAE